MTGYLALLDHKFEQTQQKLAALIQKTEKIPQSTVLLETLADLSTTFEEAHVLSEKLSTQHDELRVSQSTLSVEHQQYCELFNLVPDGYIVTDQQGLIQQINLIAANLLNRRQRLCIGKPLVVLIAPADRQHFYTLLNCLREGTALQDIDLCLYPYQGQPLLANFTITVVRDSLTQIVGFHWLFRDLTAQHQASIDLRESEQRYTMLAAAVPVGLFHTDALGNCIYVNERWHQIAGRQRSLTSGDGWRAGIHPDDCARVTAEWALSVQENRLFQLEYRFQRPDGKVTWVYGQSVTERDSEGQVLGHVCSITDISALKQSQDLIIHNALHDALTNLPNRTLLIERLELTINKAKRHQSYHYAVLFLDLDRFKLVNDSLGHAVGDQLLIQISQKLKSHLRDIDLVARLGGDEFVILLEDSNGPEQVIQIAERILADFQRPLMINESQIFTSFSLGIVLGTADYHQASALIRDADIAMYRAKVQGKNNYQIFDVSMYAQAQTRLTLETDLHQALDHEEFTVYYQPVFDISDQRLVGFEALVRWQHPTRGFVLPDDFVSVTEEMGLIVPIDKWVFYQACQQMVRWQSQYADCCSLKISINLSAQDLCNPRLIQDVDGILAETGLAGDAITLEITESMLIEDIDQTIDVLSDLASRNIEISIDDFGTGYSSLNYLHRLPVNSLKIDGSFVGQMQVDNGNYQVVNTIISLSKQLGLTVVAEGIETPEQLQQLQHLGCQLGQGNLFAPPLTVADIEARFLKVKG